MKSIKNINNIKKIDLFFNTDDCEKLIINQVNNEIGSFYLTVIRLISKNYDVNLDFSVDLLNCDQDNDLFGQKKINILELTKTKDVERVLQNRKKSILLTDYKNFKKYKDTINSVNGYNYTSDISYFLNIFMKINNVELLNLCLATPQLTYSEISKYLINKENYLKDASIAETANFILEIRKNIFENKKKGDIKNIFKNLKEEAKYKKFNFLTY